MIGWYVHHQGRGHTHRAAVIAARLGHPVTGLSSAPRPPGWPGEWVALPLDHTDEHPTDPSAGGTLHWAPLASGYRDRMAVLAAWIRHARPELLVVDASVEVTLLARLLGVRVVVVAAPGDRLDRPHRAAYDAAEHLLAPWPAWVRPAGWPRRWLDKTTAVGALSRFDERPTPPVRPGSVVVLWGAGGLDVGSTQAVEQVAEAAAATPQRRWSVLGGADPACWSADPWPVLAGAEVVITHAGQNALAEVAAARRPALVLPQRRPHAEQAATGRVLAAAGLAQVLGRWPTPWRWDGLLTSARERGGRSWETWNDGAGADRAAGALESWAACVPV